MAEATAKDIFFDALDLKADERNAFLDSACGHDASLRDQVAALLSAHDEADSFLDAGFNADQMSGLAEGDGAAHDPGQTTPLGAGAFRPRNVRLRDQAIGEIIGPYTITDFIGEGGFGMVYKADQSTPVERRVAIKIIKPGMNSQQVLRRFELERQALAMMDHPGIARVYDAGAVDDGRPFVVMEYVDGVPLTEFCDTHRLSIDERLALFERVCRAVQHAHQKGVIHRDLKPSNVLVSMVDGVPVPRVIDFGIAKALERDDAEKAATAITMDSQVIGTPQYMSPEQASMQMSRIDTRSDVYSLGVMLYELLVGDTPVDGDAIRAGGWREAERLICESDPKRPSTRIAGLGDQEGEVASSRKLDGHRLWRAVKGDLDWIVMRALERDPARRYPTADALADEIARFRRHEPVEAGPPGRMYRLGKFARRHRLELSAAVVVTAAVLTLAIGAIVFGVRERDAKSEIQERLAQTQALSSFAQELFLSLDPSVSAGEDTTLVRKLLAGARDRVATELKDYPEAATAMRNTIGGGYFHLNDLETAAECYQEALDIGIEELGGTNQHVVDARVNLASMFAAMSRFEEAIEHFVPVIEYRINELGPDHDDTLDARANLGYAYQHNAQPKKAIAELEDVLERLQRTRNDNDPDTLRVMNNLASAYTDVDEMDRAIDMLIEVLEAQRAINGDVHQHTLATMNNLAGAYMDTDRLAEAIAMFEEVLGVKRAMFDQDHWSLVITLNNLGGALRKAEMLDGAEANYDEALDMALRLSETDPRVSIVRNGIAMVYADQERYDEAEGEMLAAIDGISAVAGPTSPHVLQIRANLAGMYNTMERFHDAAEQANLVITHGSASPGPDWPPVIKAKEYLEVAEAALDARPTHESGDDTNDVTGG